jgi:hypothetical protein
VDRLAATINDPAASPREATAAARAILEASRVNLESIRTTIAAEEHEHPSAAVTLAELARKLREADEAHDRG